MRLVDRRHVAVVILVILVIVCVAQGTPLFGPGAAAQDDDRDVARLERRIERLEREAAEREERLDEAREEQFRWKDRARRAEVDLQDLRKILEDRGVDESVAAMLERLDGFVEAQAVREAAEATERRLRVELEEREHRVERMRAELEKREEAYDRLGGELEERIAAAERRARAEVLEAKARIAEELAVAVEARRRAESALFRARRFVIEKLDSDDPDDRRDAIEVCGRARIRQAVEPLRAILEDDAQWRREAAMALVRILGEARVVEVLEGMARDRGREAADRASALTALADHLGHLEMLNAVAIAREIGPAALLGMAGSGGPEDLQIRLALEAWRAGGDVEARALLADLLGIGDEEVENLSIEDVETRWRRLGGLGASARAAFERLEGTRIEVEFSGTSLPEAARFLSETTGLNVLVLAGAREATATLEGTRTALGVVEALADGPGIDWAIRDGLVLLGSPADIERSSRFRRLLPTLHPVLRTPVGAPEVHTRIEQLLMTFHPAADVPLSEVLEFLGEILGVPVELDPAAVDAAKEKVVPATLGVRDIRVLTLLRLVCLETGFEASVTDEGSVVFGRAEDLAPTYERRLPFCDIDMGFEDDETADRVLAALTAPRVDLDLIAVPAKEVLERLDATLGDAIVDLEGEALERARLDRPVSLQADSIKALDALLIILDQVDLGIRIHADGRLEIRVP